MSRINMQSPCVPHEVHAPVHRERRACELDRSWLVLLEIALDVEPEPLVEIVLCKRHSAHHCRGIARLDGSLQDLLQLPGAETGIGVGPAIAR